MKEIESVFEEESLIQTQVKKYAKLIDLATTVYSLPPSISTMIRLAHESEQSNFTNLKSKAVILRIKAQILTNQITEMKQGKISAKTTTPSSLIEIKVKGNAALLEKSY